jgi:hypothetical protein
MIMGMIMGMRCIHRVFVIVPGMIVSGMGVPVVGMPGSVLPEAAGCMHPTYEQVGSILRPAARMKLSQGTGARDDIARRTE